MTVTREKLYEEIWAEPITKVAKRYGVSDSFLVRVCKRLNVPRPPMGYWAKLAVGKASPCSLLPEAKPGDELEWSRDGQAARVPLRLSQPRKAIPSKRVRRKSNRPARHSLLVGATAHFKNVRETNGEYLKPYKKLLLDLIVSKTLIDRALDAANEFFLLLEDRGHRVVLAPPDQHFNRGEVDEREKSRPGNHYSYLWRPARSTIVYIGTVAIGLTIFEMSEEIEMRYLNGKYIPVADLPITNPKTYSSIYSWTTKQDKPSGRLCLQAYSPYPGTDWKRQWRESKAGEFPSKFKTIVKELELEASTIATLVDEAARQAEIRRQEWEIERQKWRREEEERKQAKALKESKEELFKIIEAWTEAKRIEEFFSDAENRAANLDENDREAVLDRLKEARELLGGVDALERFLVWKAPNER